MSVRTAYVVSREVLGLKTIHTIYEDLQDALAAMDEIEDPVIESFPYVKSTLTGTKSTYNSPDNAEDSQMIYVVSLRVGKHDNAYISFTSREEALRHLDNNPRSSFTPIPLHGEFVHPRDKTANIWKDTQFDHAMNKDIAEMDNPRLFILLEALSLMATGLPEEVAEIMNDIVLDGGSATVRVKVKAARDLIKRHEKEVHLAICS